MMKTTPLAVWAQNLSLQELEQCVKSDVSMMHSQKVMWDLVTAYCLAIKTLIKNSGKENRAQLAIAAVREYGNQDGITGMVNQFLDEAKALAQKVSSNASQQMDQSYKLVAGNNEADSDVFNIDVYNPQTQMGFVKHAFVLSMYVLKRCEEKPLSEVYSWAML